MGGVNSGVTAPKKPYRHATSEVSIWYGVFINGELETVEHSYDAASEAALRLSQPDAAAKPKYEINRSRIIAPVIILTTDLSTRFLYESRLVLEGAVVEFNRLKRAEDKMIEEATKEKTRLPPNYWEPRYKAWLKMEAAKRVVEALENGTAAVQP